VAGLVAVSLPKEAVVAVRDPVPGTVWRDAGHRDGRELGTGPVHFDISLHPFRVLSSLAHHQAVQGNLDQFLVEAASTHILPIAAAWILPPGAVVLYYVGRPDSGLTWMISSTHAIVLVGE